MKSVAHSAHSEPAGVPSGHRRAKFNLYLRDGAEAVGFGRLSLDDVSVGDE